MGGCGGTSGAAGGCISSSALPRDFSSSSRNSSSSKQADDEAWIFLASLSTNSHTHAAQSFAEARDRRSASVEAGSSNCSDATTRDAASVVTFNSSRMGTTHGAAGDESACRYEADMPTDCMQRSAERAELDCDRGCEEGGGVAVI